MLQRKWKTQIINLIQFVYIFFSLFLLICICTYVQNNFLSLLIISYIQYIYYKTYNEFNINFLNKLFLAFFQNIFYYPSCMIEIEVCLLSGLTYKKNLRKYYKQKTEGYLISIECLRKIKTSKRSMYTKKDTRWRQ